LGICFYCKYSPLDIRDLDGAEGYIITGKDANGAVQGLPDDGLSRRFGLFCSGRGGDGTEQETVFEVEGFVIVFGEDVFRLVAADLWRGSTLNRAGRGANWRQSFLRWRRSA
jgi:hypothetical protein